MEGTRVVRGPSWKYGNQDASEGHVGTVVDFKEKGLLGSTFPYLISPHQKSLGTVIVAWDSGVRAVYRIGHEGAFDLRIVDNSAAGVKHPNISCTQCSSQNEITGMRWHCETCGVSLCSSCFFKKKHDQTHIRFQRFETPYASPVAIVLDQEKRRIEMKGIFVGATVKRGHDWNSGNEDHTEDGDEGVGQVIEAANPTPGKVNVKWSNGNTFSYRLGSEGKSDLKLVATSSFGHYNPEHLPVLKSELMKAVVNSDGKIKFAVGDAVTVNSEIDANRLEEMQEGHGGWDERMRGLIGKTGIVRGFAEHGISVQYDGLFDRLWMINPEALLRLSSFSMGQPIQIKDDPDTILKISQQHGNPTARDVAGETGKIVYSDQSGQIEVVLDDSEKKIKKIRLDQNWVTIIPGDESVDKGMAKLKSKTVSVLVNAAASGKLNVIKTLLTNYPVEVDSKNDSGRTALHVACLHGHHQTVLWLLGRGADLKLKDDKGRRALHHAAKGCHPDILTLLIEKGAKLDVLDKKMLTPLQLAVKAGCFQSVSVLIKNLCNINLQDLDGDTALNNAIIQEQRSYRDPGIVDILVLSPAIDLKMRNNRGYNPLLLSVAVGNIRVSERLLLLPNGAGKELAAEESTDIRFTTLHMVCFKGEIKFAKILLSHLKPFITADGRDLRELRCQGGMTPLLLSVYCGHHALVELLVERGEVDIKATDDDGDTAVHIAAIRLENLKEKPKELTSPAIFKIHKELSESHPAEVDSYPALSIMCYLIKKGCPWRRSHSRKANAIINNELIRGILESYSPSLEPIDVYTESTNGMAGSAGCLLCPQKVTVESTFEDCRHTISLTCAQCFSRLHKCPTCQGKNTSFDATNSANYVPNLSPYLKTCDHHQKKQHNKNVCLTLSCSQDEIHEMPKPKRPRVHLSPVIIPDMSYQSSDMILVSDEIFESGLNSSHNGLLGSASAITEAGTSNLITSYLPAGSSVHSNLRHPSPLIESLIDLSYDLNISFNSNSSHGVNPFSNEYCQTDPYNSDNNLATIYNPGSHWNSLNNVYNSSVNWNHSSNGSPLHSEDLSRLASDAGQEIICSIKKGRKTEILDDGKGNSYGKQRTSTVNGDETWRCTKSQGNRKKTKCPATIIRSNDGVCRFGKYNHIHPQGSHRHGD